MPTLSLPETPALEVAPPPLEPGDRLTRAEFERRYEAMPHLKKAELIDGVVSMPSPVRYDRHGNPHFRLIGWLSAYEAATPGASGGDNSTVRLNEDTEVQPDVLLRIAGLSGQARLGEEDYVEGAPELVGEVSASSVSFDLHTKLHAYRRGGVREYLVWRVLDREFDWFLLRSGQYERLASGADGVLRSEVFPGLWLDAAALLRGDMNRVLAVLREGTASPEHAAFVVRLAAAE